MAGARFKWRVKLGAGHQLGGRAVPIRFAALIFLLPFDPLPPAHGISRDASIPQPGAYPQRNAGGGADRVAPADAAQAGLVRQTAAGRSMPGCRRGGGCWQNISRIVREEQDASGAQEMLMPTIQSADLWKTSGRYDAYGPEMLRLRDRHERELLHGPTNEEMITDIFRSAVEELSGNAADNAVPASSGNSATRCGPASA